ncbi:MAG TPA: efflux RND transporter periplasmic adaptor subunit [Gemmatimonadales bacterium]|nr:efflux RND transporter periplasmic adaptor subunit [Gemmatimonadales bacterium]
MRPRFRFPLLAGLAAIGCTSARPAERAAAPPAEAVPAARVAPAEAAGRYRAAGTVRAARRAELSTRLTGRVESVRVRAGDVVRAGQLLLTVERGSLTAAQQQAASALELATASLRRVERLYADSAAPLVQLEAARTAQQQARAQAASVQADLAYAEVRAPFAGVVTGRLVDPGDQSAPGEPLLVVEDRAAREIVVTVPDDVGEQLRPGQTASVEIGTTGRRVTARIEAVVAGADPQSPTVEVRLAGPAGLSPGLAAVAELPAAGRSAMEIPRTALTRRGQLEGVYLFAPDSTLRLRWIRTGRGRDSTVEVLSGLLPGDLVALDASRARDGVRARPLLPAGGE